MNPAPPVTKHVCVFVIVNLFRQEPGRSIASAASLRNARAAGNAPRRGSCQLPQGRRKGSPSSIGRPAELRLAVIISPILDVSAVFGTKLAASSTLGGMQTEARSWQLRLRGDGAGHDAAAYVDAGPIELPEGLFGGLLLRHVGTDDKINRIGGLCDARQMHVLPWAAVHDG
jgi:hypothetical protein